MTTKILIFSSNPVPTKEYKTVEGSALRFWRMALALKSHGYDDITIAVWERFPQKHPVSEGIKLVNFAASLKKMSILMKDYDVVIFSCALGEISRRLLKAASAKNQVIVDAYSPMYVEILTKSHSEREDKEELKNYNYYVNVFNECLIKTDYALVANESQRHLYRGVLAAQGALVDYDDSKFIDLPAFVEISKGVKQKAIKERDRINVLWFGGVYPWFDINNIIKVFADPDIKRIAKLTVVGGSNPFYPKNNKRFNGKYMNAKKLSDELGLTDNTIFFGDWVDYHDRIKIFNDADVAISINNLTVENDYSFRLRVADLVGNGVPVITNAGDPLGEELLSMGVAFRLDTSSRALIKDSMKIVLANRSGINEAKKRLIGKEIYERLHIDGYINNLIQVIENGSKPRLAKRRGPEVDEYTQAQEAIVRINTKNLLKLTGKRLVRAAGARSKRIFKR